MNDIPAGIYPRHPQAEISSAVEIARLELRAAKLTHCISEQAELVSLNKAGTGFWASLCEERSEVRKKLSELRALSGASERTAKGMI